MEVTVFPSAFPQILNLVPGPLYLRFRCLLQVVQSLFEIFDQEVPSTQFLSVYYILLVETFPELSHLLVPCMKRATMVSINESDHARVMIADIILRIHVLRWMNHRRCLARAVRIPKRFCILARVPVPQRQLFCRFPGAICSWEEGFAGYLIDARQS